MSNDNTYNGWTNYATWRVNLEMFDGWSADDSENYGITSTITPYEGGKILKEYAEESIEQTSTEGLARDYALAFLSDVNWREIAQHLIDDAADA